MKRSLATLGLGVGLSLLLVVPGSAQSSLFFTVGPTMPTSDFSETANTGWLVTGGLGFPVTEDGSTTFVLEGLIGGNDRGEAGDSDIYGAMGHLQLNFGGTSDRATPFVFGGAGLLGDKTDLVFVPDNDTNWQVALNGGAGIGFDLGNADLILLSRYVHGFDDLTFFNVQAGVSFPVGGDGM